MLLAGGDCVYDLPDSAIPAAADNGLAWVTEPDARALGSAQTPLSYFLNLKLKDPATAPAFASRIRQEPAQRRRS